MNAYFNSILTLAIISGIVGSLLSNHKEIKKYVSYFLSLIMILIIMTPLFNILSSFSKIEEYIEDFYHSIKTEEIIENSNSLIVNTTEKNVCDGIKEMIISKFGFDENDVFVSLNCDKSDINAIKINSVNIILTNKASWSDTDKVKEYLDKMIGCEINVTRR